MELGRVKKRKRVVCPYCGIPNNDPGGICPNCGNETDPNRLYANPVGTAWRGMRLLHRLPARGEPGEGPVRLGLLVIGVVFLWPLFLSLISLITPGNAGPAGGPVTLLLLGLTTPVGIILCFRSIRPERSGADRK